jgi:hypothetical protein
VNPGIELQGAGTYAFRVGDIVITALSDGTVPQDLHALLLWARLMWSSFRIDPTQLKRITQ